MGPSLNKSLVTNGDIIDIGGSKMSNAVTERLLIALQAPYDVHNKPVLPDEPLYDDKGLNIWNELIFTPEFYQTHDEMALLKKHGHSIASQFPSGVYIIDIGAGDTRKVECLLEAFEEAEVPATYFALDISLASLRINVKRVADQHPTPYSYVKCVGLYGNFENGREWVSNVAQGPILFLSLGSVLCNDEWDQAVNNLKAWKNVMHPEDLMIVGMDAHMAEEYTEKIEAAYHTNGDLWRDFFLNGFINVNKRLYQDVFDEANWRLCCELEHDPTTRHRVYFRAKRPIKCARLKRVIQTGEEVDWFDSHKYCENDVQIMCSQAGLSVVDIWKADGSEFRQYAVKIKYFKDAMEDEDSGVSDLC